MDRVENVVLFKYCLKSKSYTNMARCRQWMHAEKLGEEELKRNVQRRDNYEYAGEQRKIVCKSNFKRRLAKQD
ncbi:hypothetical protein HUJ05_005398 [Dendroctonus ponderosae]|nr:hypothetical protein HUJ05_005398 [Dendroctonus ponderosae]